MVHLTGGMGAPEAAPVVFVVDDSTASRELIEAYLTAFAMIGDRERTLAADDRAYVSTQIDSRTFATEIRKFLASTA